METQNVLACPTCQGRMKLLRLVKDAASIARTLAAAGQRVGTTGGAVCALGGVGATEHSPGGGERMCRSAIGGPKGRRLTH